MTTEVVNTPEHPILSHLLELRSRIVIILLAVTIGAIIGWIVYPVAFELVAGPLLKSVKAFGGHVFTLQPGEAFFTQCKLAMVIGIVLASPVIMWQLWLFVRPALTEKERKAISPLMPAISVLFIAGVVFGYYLLPSILQFFLGYVPHGVAPNMDFQNSINFPLKLMLTFGLVFQLPIVILGLIAFGVLTPTVLLKQWRVAIIAIAVLAAILSPSPDPFNMIVVMMPLLMLYFGTVLLAYWLQRKEKKTDVS